MNKLVLPEHERLTPGNSLTFILRQRLVSKNALRVLVQKGLFASLDVDFVTEGNVGSLTRLFLSVMRSQKVPQWVLVQKGLFAELVVVLAKRGIEVH